MSIDSLSEIKKVYVEFLVNVTMDLLDQMIKSPETIAGTNQLSSLEIDRLKQNQRTIAKKALELEADYIIKKDKIKTRDELFNKIEQMPSNEIGDIRKKFLAQLIEEFTKHG
jgi:hypothetical protein